LHQQKTEIVAQNTQLDKLNVVKDKIFSIIAHDLRSPFNSLIAILNFLESGNFGQDKLNRYLPQLKTIVNTTLRTLDNLLHWARLQMEGVEMTPEVFDLSKILIDKLILFSKAASEKEITLVNEFEPEIYVHADINHVRLILRNLINNAVKFTEPNGKIFISSKIRNNLVEISVRDTGIGITQENQKRLFKPDEHFTTYGTSREKGTGLGLILCKEFVEKNGGKIWVISKTGSGTTFTFSLPVSSAEKLKNAETKLVDGIAFTVRNNTLPAEKMHMPDNRISNGLLQIFNTLAEQPEEFANQIIVSIRPLYLKANKTKSMQQIKNFAKAVQMLGQKFDNQIFDEYGENLTLHVENFVVNEILISMKMFEPIEDLPIVKKSN